jgi:hypothetical protein
MKETPKLREEVFVCMFYGHVGHLNEFYFRHFDYARNSYCDEFLDFPPRSYSRALLRTSSRVLPRFSHRPNHRSYDFDSREDNFVPRRFSYDQHPHRDDRFLSRPVFF